TVKALENMPVHLLAAMIALGLFATTASVAALAYPLINIHGSQGRLFFFPALPAFAILLTVGWRELLPHRAWTKWTFGVYIAAIVGVALYAWFGVLRPAYHPPRMLNPQQLPTNLARQDEAFGNLATLVGVSLPAARVSPGDEISVTPCWQVNATTTQNLREFVQIVRLSDAVKIGARDTYPGLGHYPTSRWRRGDLFCDPIPVRIVDDIPTPGVYSVLVGLYSDDPNAAFAHTVTAGDVVVGPSQVDVTGLTLLHARYENAVELVGYKRNGLELMLYWRVLGKPQADMSLFTHLFDAAAQPIVLSDGAPLSGQFPAPVWEVGDVFVETRTFAPPKGHAAGPSSWQVGWYWRSSGQRLRVEIDGNRLRDDVVVIPGPQLP
ncbi:MAG: hypothetical protein ACE5FI_10055, partial [Anaerolineales bacterium]